MKLKLFYLITITAQILGLSPMSFAETPTWTCASPTAKFNFYYHVVDDQPIVSWDEIAESSGSIITGLNLTFDVMVLKGNFALLSQSWNTANEFTFMKDPTGKITGTARSSNTGQNAIYCTAGVSALISKNYLSFPRECQR